VADVMPAMALLGIGAGLAFPALMTVAMTGATPEDAGLASGLVNTTAQVGGALGLAVLATLSASHTHALSRAGDSTQAALTGGYHLAFWIAAALVACAIAVAATALPRRHAVVSDLHGDTEQALASGSAPDGGLSGERAA
jgi:MFS family permease